ncbi:MAG: copper-translocating P-type ATPase [Candidatus Bathyarchaeia archaeon]
MRSNGKGQGQSHHGHHPHRGHHNHAHHIEDFKRRFLASAALTIPILLLSEMIQEWLGLRFRIPLQGEALLLLSSIVYLYGGSPFIRGALEEIRGRRPGMMTLIGMAISVAFFYSAGAALFALSKDFFWELATLIDVMLLGHWVEAKSVLGASRALEELVGLLPATAHLIRDGGVEDVPASSLKAGDVVLVRPGERIPSDGLVIEGESSAIEALLTGESKPVRKGVGDNVIGGSVNAEGALKVRIERTGEETYIAQVIRLVRQAQESRSRTQDLADRAAALLFYIALAAGALTYAAWAPSGPAAALERAVTVLVIACPHALGLAIPLVVAISTSITAKGGILIRNRGAFERAKDVDAVIFDKTGTLTEGSFGVSDVIPFSSEEELLGLAAGLELNSEHVIAKAIVEYAKGKGVRVPSVEGFESMPGKGARGRVGGREVCVGGQALLDEMGARIEDPRIRELQAQGKTVVFVLADGRPLGAIALSDRMREESREAVEELRDMGISVYMVTGDSVEVARWVAGELGIRDYFAQVLPHQKVEKVELLKGRGHRVAMVGDGINDAPALAAADVGIAIGAGTDVAIESADIILVRNDPRDVPKAIRISRRAYSKMVQNLWWASGYNAIAIPLAAGALSGLGISVSPAVGAIVMSLSTIIVALNSQALRKHEPRGPEMAEREHLTIDPVCGMMVEPEEAAGRAEVGKYVIYFCSKGCEEEFKKDPSGYLKKALRARAKSEPERHHHH